MHYQVVKPILLMGVLAFMVGSYFTSDALRRGYSMPIVSVLNKVVVEVLCGDKAKVERDRCADNVDRALIPSTLGCSSAVHDMVFCHNPRMDVKTGGDRCHEEETRAYKCLKSRLVPRLQQRGFSSEEIAALDVFEKRDAKKANLRKQNMGEDLERPAEKSGDADVARENADSPEVDIVERPREDEGADAGEVDANVPGIDIESAER